MSEQLFRKKSLERVSSPEELNEYIRVSNPGVWMVLVAVVVLLVGVCVWGVLGQLDTVVSLAALSEDGAVTAYISAEEIDSVAVGMPVRIHGEEYTVASIASEPVAVDDFLSEYARHLGGLQNGQWVYALGVDASLPDGVYPAELVVESVSPMSFVLN